jgi:hypothetical protein
MVLTGPCELPAITLTQRIRAAIYCVRAVGFADLTWDRWAHDWLRGKDRSAEAARAALSAAAAREESFNLTDIIKRAMEDEANIPISKI